MTYDEVFSFRNLTKSSKKCKKGVRWKPSVQKYISHELLPLTKIYLSLQERNYVPRKIYKFDKIERGKLRHIQSQCIEDRVVHKCFCDNLLVPLLAQKLIYDNSACIKGKGTSFARKRIICHLQRYFRHFGNTGYILQFDIHSFFENIPHDKLKEKISKLLTDPDLINFFNKTIDECGTVGLGLGSQISQICATYYLNELDQYIKHKLKIRYYARYMDDGYLIHQDKEYLKYCLTQITRILNNLGLELNKKKTYIVKLTHSFVFLKRKYIMSPTGKIVVIPSKSGVVRERRKIKKLFKMNIPIIKIRNSIISWYSSVKDTNSYCIQQNIKRLYYKLKGEKKYEEKFLQNK